MEDINKYLEDIDVVDDILIEWFLKRMDIVDKIIDWQNANPFDERSREDRSLETVIRRHYRSVDEKYQKEYMYFQTYLLKIAKEHKEERNNDEQNSDNV